MLCINGDTPLKHDSTSFHFIDYVWDIIRKIKVEDICFYWLQIGGKDEAFSCFGRSSLPDSVG